MNVVLSNREKEIIAWVNKGFTNIQIAEKCLIEESSVKNHLQRIFKKLHIKKRTQLQGVER